MDKGPGLSGETPTPPTSQPRPAREEEEEATGKVPRSLAGAWVVGGWVWVCGGHRREPERLESTACPAAALGRQDKGRMGTTVSFFSLFLG